ncbi:MULTISPECIES: polyprenyl synthetase family protein [Enterococcus]|uniref:Polyprenyl synthetase n=1 Tax=Candidatus Enterococcus mangumiae TaxID=2230878 RepID=A0ABZ2T062_9ENTE|nr:MULTISPECIES: polyprenyl synthetase family protein [unclassified Enterococcus]MBO0462298.1 polyprenyl synthetase family protein [Enterococcus sp. DIV1298c]MBO0490918.1 polyprenyl synthetase family protein [Enterococcus sp. DIV1094]MBO1298923.1 polyprenyl synthetase family protein [Enterococcus sp. DIV1271a]
MKLHQMWRDYPTIQMELNQTLKKMESVVRLKNKPVEEAIKETIHAGGKLLRPAYQLLFAQFGPEQDREKAISLAASIEMLHIATLIHDDIVDEADVRRGQPNLRSRFGNSVAVYAGDYLFVCCFKLLSEYASSLKSMQLNARSMEKVLNGELGQMDDRYNAQLSVEEYLQNISGKTAELFQLSCFVGAYESGTSERFAKKAGDIGLAIGMAFQIMDDILDYTKQSEDIGKPVLEDIRQGVYSLPLIYALQTEKKAELLECLSKEKQMTQAEAEKVQQLVVEAKGVENAQKLAESYTKKALKEIKKLPDTSLQTKETLEKLTAQILNRVD